MFHMSKKKEYCKKNQLMAYNFLDNWPLKIMENVHSQESSTILNKKNLSHFYFWRYTNMDLSKIFNKNLDLPNH